MGRIDEALRRTEPENPATVIVPGPDATPEQAAAGEVFSSPWTFGSEEPAEGGVALAPVPSESPTEIGEVLPADPALGGAPGQMALFKGFKKELTGRLVTSEGASPMLTEQFRRLAGTLHHSQIVQGTKVVMVTSASPGDGKTLTSTNLALTLSESYRRQVLLIDADLRRPSLHEVFQVPNVVGLNDGLKAQREGRLEVIKITSSLTLLPAGRPDPDPMSSLTSDRMREILEEAAERFDWIIVDTAPVGLLADANLLTRIVDGALLVIRANETRHAAVQRALENLGREKVLGVVLNAVEAAAGDTEKYGYGYMTPGTGATPPALS